MRYQLMFALASPCRCDFSESFGGLYSYPIERGASRLRRMVLDRADRL